MTRRMRVVWAITWLAAVAAVLVTTAVAAMLNARLRATSGLRGEYSAETHASLRQIESAISRALLDRLSRAFGGQPFQAEWRGYLIVPVSGAYRFAVPADDAAALEIDGQRAADSSMQLGPVIALTGGLHEFRLRYVDHGGLRHLALLWARGDRGLTALSPLLLVPDLPEHAELRQRSLLLMAGRLLPVATTMLVVLPALWLGVRLASRHVRARDADEGARGHMPLLAIAATLVFASGSWWGAPAYGTWAPDEVMPSDVLFALESRFASGWATIYPPFHYAVLAILYLPHVLGSMAGLVDVNALDTSADMLVMGRLFSVAMAVGTLAIVYEIGREHFGPRAGLFAALVTAVSLPLAYYSKTANLDVPYVFWLTLSLVFYLRSYRKGTLRDFCLFCVTGVAAVCTKDQAYGFYVLPAAYMGIGALVRTIRPVRLPGIPTPGTLALMAAVTLGSFTLFWNLPFNVEGFREHVRLIAGPASEGFRMYPRSAAGHLRMAFDATVQVAQAMSWPLALAALAGVCAAALSRVPFLLYLLLPAISYYLCFISVVMYHYDRFFLGTIVILALLTGRWLQEWTVRGNAGGDWKIALLCGALLYAGSRSVALDILMIRDSRYEAEAFLRHSVAPGQLVAALGSSLYLPRPAVRPWQRIEPEELDRVRPDYLVLNAGYERRSPSGSPRRAFYDTLASGESGYRLSGRYRTILPISPLALEPRFRRLEEDQHSNLTKVNPIIEVYVRK